MANQPSKSSPTNLFLVGIVSVLLMGIGIFFRIWNLNIIPAGLYYDEMDNVFLGESVARYGTDITGTWSPPQLRPLSSLNLNAELSSVFHAISQRIIGFGGAAAHVPNAFFGIMTGVVVILMMKMLTGKWLPAILTGGLLLTNPWYIHISRTAYEAGISIFFQTLIIFGFIWFNKSKRLVERIISICIAITGVFLGFFTYHGAKFTIPVVVFFMTVYLLMNHKKINTVRFLIATLPLLLCIVLGGYYWYLNGRGVLGSRQNELIVSTQYIKDEVDSRRKMSVDFPGKSIVINKATVLIDEAVKRYLFVFDLHRLFSQGKEDSFQFSLFVSPQFYLSSLLFLILGLYYCLKLRDYRFIVGLLLVSPVTSVITQGYQSIFRSGLTYISLIIITGIGLSNLMEYLDKTGHRLLIVGLLGIMLIEVVLFGGNYFGRYPVVAANNHYFFEKLLSGYLRQFDNKVIIITSSPFTLARSIVIYLQLMPSLSLPQRAQFNGAGTDTFDLGNIIVTANCPKHPLSSSMVVIFDLAKRKECNLDTKTAIQLASPIDSGTYYFIINDPLCKKAEIAHYVYVTNINYFDVTRLSADQICHNWMRKE